MGVIAPLVGRWFDRVGPRPLVTPGAIMMSLARWGMTMLGESTPTYVIVVIHVMLNIGLGFMIAPLMTSALGSLPRRLFSHGSAIVSTGKQLAAAAGTAVFVTVMTATAATTGVAGVDAVGAQAAGAHAAFFRGTGISLIAVLGGWVVKRPPADADAPQPGLY